MAWLLDRLPAEAHESARFSNAGTIAWRGDGRYLRLHFATPHRIDVVRDCGVGRREFPLNVAMDLCELTDLVRWATSSDSSPS